MGAQDIIILSPTPLLFTGVWVGAYRYYLQTHNSKHSVKGAKTVSSSSRSGEAGLRTRKCQFDSPTGHSKAAKIRSASVTYRKGKWVLRAEGPYLTTFCSQHRTGHTGYPPSLLTEQHLSSGLPPSQVQEQDSGCPRTLGTGLSAWTPDFPGFLSQLLARL